METISQRDKLMDGRGMLLRSIGTIVLLFLPTQHWVVQQSAGEEEK